MKKLVFVLGQIMKKEMNLMIFSLKNEFQKDSSSKHLAEIKEILNLYYQRLVWLRHTGGRKIESGTYQSIDSAKYLLG